MTHAPDPLEAAARAVRDVISRRNCEIAGRPIRTDQYDELDEMIAAEHASAAVLAFLDTVQASGPVYISELRKLAETGEET